MTADSFQDQVESTGHFIFDKMRGEKPSFFQNSWWEEKIIKWSINNPIFRKKLFKFIDVLPSLKTDQQIVKHIKEYFTDEDEASAALLKLGAGTAGLSALTAKLAAKSIKKKISAMAQNFIVGENMSEAVTRLGKMWKEEKIAFTADFLGEKSLSSKESLEYQQKYIDLLQNLADETRNWPHNPILDNSDYHQLPRLNISVRTELLYPHFDAFNFEGTVREVIEKLRPILRQAKALNCFVTLNLTKYETKEINLEIFKRILMEDEFINWENAGIVIQSYLKDSEEDLLDLIEWSKKRKTAVAVRLVKGAYWDYEMILAKQHNINPAVWTKKHESDANFEKLIKMLFENREYIHPRIATHNIRNIAYTIELAKNMQIPNNGFEFQMLYGMGEPIKKVLVDMQYCVRNYTPISKLDEGMSYFVRRLIENTADEGFLKKNFFDGSDNSELLADPFSKTEIENDETEEEESNEFTNESLFDFSKHEVREKFRTTIKAARDKYFNRKFGLIIHGKEIATDEWNRSVNPSNPNEVVGTVGIATKDDAKFAVESSKRAFQVWAAHGVEERTDVLKNIASILRRRKYELAAIIVCEAGKTWKEADAEVADAIDSCEYYAREMLKLTEQHQTKEIPGETSEYLYEPKGVGAIITPWNFPLAIPMGMIAASIVTGNCAVFKPASNTPVTAAHLMQVLKEANLPEGVVNFIPSKGEEIGDYLVDHPDIKFIAFTGSKEVGLRIIERASKINEGQKSIKTVIAELGGKNAIIIDEDADISGAIEGVIASAFGYQGQKCSACSRLIILESIYDEFIMRFTEAVKDLNVGTVEDTRNQVGPVISEEHKKKVMGYIEKAKEEEKLLVDKKCNCNKGFCVPVSIFEINNHESAITREEIFGPVLAIMKAKNLDEALEIANNTEYALTGGLYSRSPENIKKARESFEVGNLYINRGITGAAVGKTPFGGFKLSGSGAKVGGPDYLRQFMKAQTVLEKTSICQFD